MEPQANGDELLLNEITNTENSIKNLIKAIASFGTPKQSMFVGYLWTQITDMKENQEQCIEIKSWREA